MTPSRPILAVASIIAGMWMVTDHFGSSSVEAPYCAPSRDAQLKPRWLHGALESAGIEAEKQLPQPVGLIGWLASFGPRAAPEPTNAFIYARRVLKGLTMAGVLGGSVHGARVAGQRVTTWLSSCAIGAGGVGVATAVMLFSFIHQDDWGALFVAAVVLGLTAAATCLLCTPIILIGVLDGLRLLGRVTAEKLSYLVTPLSPSKPTHEADESKRGKVPIGVPVLLGRIPSDEATPAASATATTTLVKH